MPERVGPVGVYTDGGCVGQNPSPDGGTYAWVYVWEDGESAGGHGVVTPEDIGLPAVTNNLTEFIAVLFALEHLPAGWSGPVYSDSGVTIQRFRDGAKLKGIPDGFAARLRPALARLGKITFVLLGGHPTRKELAAGVRKDGKPVSKWNVYCDQKCQDEARKMTAALKVARERSPCESCGDSGRVAKEDPSEDGPTDPVVDCTNCHANSELCRGCTNSRCPCRKPAES